MTIEYWLPDLGEDGSSPYRFDFKYSTDIWTWLAEEAAEDFHANHDGWECKWPLKIAVRPEGSDVRTFEVQRRSVPEFEAEEIK